jgi:hypothetical protein
MNGYVQLQWEKAMQDDMDQAELDLKSASHYTTKTAMVVVDSINKLTKHETAVMKLQQEAALIRQRKEASDEEMKLKMLQDEEERFGLSQKRKDMYYQEWYDLKTEMSALDEKMSLEISAELRAEQKASPFCNHLQAQGLQNRIEEEVEKALVRERMREKRVIERLHQMEEENGD